jgi:hypothetical protein
MRWHLRSWGTSMTTREGRASSSAATKHDDRRQLCTARTGVQFVDIPLRLQQKAPVRFTFLWLEESRWEGKDYVVEVQASVAEAQARR